MSEADAGLIEFFRQDHRRCDALWAEVEGAAEREAEEDIAAAWQRFDDAMRRHLEMEEKVLFPAFEARTGMTEGPTRVMRSEHDQMRGLLEQMTRAQGDAQELLDLGDTLLLLIQQHNQKEEHMLYPMAERALSAEWAELRERLG